MHKKYRQSHTVIDDTKFLLFHLSTKQGTLQYTFFIIYKLNEQPLVVAPTILSLFFPLIDLQPVN